MKQSALRVWLPRIADLFWQIGLVALIVRVLVLLYGSAASWPPIEGVLIAIGAALVGLDYLIEKRSSADGGDDRIR